MSIKFYPEQWPDGAVAPTTLTEDEVRRLAKADPKAIAYPKPEGGVYLRLSEPFVKRINTLVDRIWEKAQQPAPQPKAKKKKP
jgi:hypothetical protein